jgi:hypothetical protein
MKKQSYLAQLAFGLSLTAMLAACKQDNTIPTPACNRLHQGVIKVVNNYQKIIRVYIDKATVYSYNYDLLIPAGETQAYTVGTGPHTYTIQDESSSTLDQAQLLIAHDCDTTTISKTSGGGGGGGGSQCANGAWGTIKLQNTYGQNIRVYIDALSIYSYNYNSFVPAGQTRYIYNINVGPHRYTVQDESSATLDQAQIQINNPCDSALISKNVATLNSTSQATGCAANNWGIIKVTNIYNSNIRVYIDATSIYSYNYDMLVPAGQSRYYFQAYQGPHSFTIQDESSGTLDKAKLYINNPCDTAVIGPLTDPGVESPMNGCTGADWGILKVINNKNEKIRVYLGTGAHYSYNYDLLLPAHSTRYFYTVITGASDYLITDESSATIEQAQFNIAQSCASAVLIVN